LTPSPSATAPAGFHWSQGPDGTSVIVPANWTRQNVSGASVRWVQPSAGAQIQLDTTPWGVADPVQHWRNFASEVRAKRSFTGFRQIRLGSRFTPRGWPAADLDFAWTTQDHGAMLASDRGFTVNGRQYALFVTFPSARRGNYADLLTRVFGSFQPPR
jgi:hypothetical protein